MSKRVLGRGLDALIPKTEPEARTPGDQILHIPLDKIRRNPEQPRHDVDTAAIEGLAESIREYGMIEPIVVKRDGDVYVLVAGERRVMAARSVGLEKVPAVLRDGDQEAMLSVALVENIQREDLNPVDEALAYRRLQDEFGLTQEEVAKRVAKSRVAVANALRILQLPAPILNDVSRGTITAGHARAILSVTDVPTRERLWTKIKKKHLSVRAAEEIARRLAGTEKKPRRRERSQSKDPQVAFFEDRLRHRLGTQVRIVQQRRGGKIEIEYYGTEDLERLLDILGVTSGL